MHMIQITGGRAMVTRREETASAMVFAIAVMLLATGVVGVIVHAGVGSSARRGSEVREQAATWGADVAAEKIRMALNGNLMSEVDDYRLTSADLATMVDDAASGETVLANSSPEVPAAFKTPDPGPASAGFVPVEAATMRQRLAGNTFGYWQVFRVQEPDYVDRMALRVWVRSWPGNGGAATGTPDSRIMVAEYRPRYFTDYEMVVNGAIRLDQNITFNGPVHSNGYYVGRDEAFDSGGTASCNTNPASGITPVRITDSQPSMSMNVAASCSRSVNEPPMSFVNFRRAFARMRAGCGITVRCFTGPGPWTVTMAGAGGTVSGPGGGTFSVADVSGLLFDGEVSVKGSIDGRLTIASNPPPGASGTGNIRIIGDVSARRGTGKGDGLGNSLGLFAQANVILGSDECVRNVDAAVMAQTGRITLDPYQTLQIDTGVRWRCLGVTFRGPTAGQRASMLLWRWDNGGSFGYTGRRFDAGWYNRDGEMRLHYRDNPPPFAPSDENWSKVNWRPANVDCFSAPATTTDCM